MLSTRLALAVALAACSSAPPKPAAAPPADVDEDAVRVQAQEALAASVAPLPERTASLQVTAPEAPAPSARPAAWPSDCAGENGDGVCAPPDDFARDVCAGFANPEAALMLFAKGTPWTRAYLRMNVDAWYTGSRSARVGLKLDEEVVVLHHPNATGGIVVNGGGAPFDVMRLDGRCATLSSEEVTLKRPPSPKHPVVPWQKLDPSARQVLLADSAVAEASTNYEGCSDASGPCAKAGGKLTAAILEFLAHGGKVPTRLTRR